jgi:Na+/phosphate symporter
VPVVFLARYDPSADTQKVFNAIWEECGASISLYLADVADQLVEALDASQWAMKKQAATAIAKISDLVNDYQMKPYAGRLFKALIAGLRGRLWSGKESFFEAVSGLVECCRNLFFASEAEKPVDLLTSTDLINAIMAECKKKNMEYKKQAVICLASVLQSLDAAAIIQGAPFAVYDSIRADVIEISTKRSTSDDEVRFFRWSASAL